MVCNFKHSVKAYGFISKLKITRSLKKKPKTKHEILQNEENKECSFVILCINKAWTVNSKRQKKICSHEARWWNGECLKEAMILNNHSHNQSGPGHVLRNNGNLLSTEGSVCWELQRLCKRGTGPNEESAGSEGINEYCRSYDAAHYHQKRTDEEEPFVTFRTLGCLWSEPQLQYWPSSYDFSLKS